MTAEGDDARAQPRPAIQRFQVAIKGLLVDQGKLLVVREADGERWWELPGGRIDVGEEGVSHEDVLRRELREELGDELRCDIGPPLVTWTRPLALAPGEFGFLVGLLCTEVSGALRLSAEHCELRWVGPHEWRTLAFAPGYDTALDLFWKRFEQRGW